MVIHQCAADVQSRRPVFNGISGAAGYQGGGWGLAPIVAFQPSAH